MKKIIILFFALVLLLGMLCSCDPIFVNMDNVVLNDKEYIRCYKDRELLPREYLGDGEVFGEYSKREFYKVEDCQFDCVVTYDNSGEAEIYFSKEEAAKAREYYDSAENYSYYCLLGSKYAKPAPMVFRVDEMDAGKLAKLHQYSRTYEYDPFALGSDESKVRDIPFDPEGADRDFVDGEICFYKKSHDGLFGSDNGYTYRIDNDKLVLLYYYDFDYGEDECIRVVDIPEDLGDYFLEIVKGLNKIETEEV